MIEDADWEVEGIQLHEADVAGCMGCFGCWIRTPGMCVIDDFSREITRKMITSDLLMYLTPIHFGGYSYHLKKAVDRMIPIVSPLFVKVEGEIHHAKRYERYPRFGAIGILNYPDENQERIFKRLVAKNAMNMYSPSFYSVVISRSASRDSIQSAIEGALRGLGVFS
jgi:multimeric flavodoxin WrbA